LTLETIALDFSTQNGIAIAGIVVHTNIIIKHMEKVGQKISPILEYLENYLWEYEATVGEKPEYTEGGFRGAVKVFMSATMDKMFDIQTKEKMTLEDMEAMVTACGNDLRKFVHTYTGIDTKELYEK